MNFVRTHGMSHSPTWVSWRRMVCRITYVKHDSYPRYGGAGLTLDPRWLKFENFLADMGPRPEGQTIERRENSKGYWPSNCSWDTPKRQARNRSSNTLVEHDGVTQTIADWAEQKGLPYATLLQRLTTRAWAVDRALNTPRDSRFHPAKGEALSIR